MVSAQKKMLAVWALVVLLLVGLLGIAGCSAGGPNSAETESGAEETSSVEAGDSSSDGGSDSADSSNSDSWKLNNKDEALEFVIEKLGDAEPDTGKKYQFMYLDQVSIEGILFYIYDVTVPNDDASGDAGSDTGTDNSSVDNDNDVNNTDETSNNETNSNTAADENKWLDTLFVAADASEIYSGHYNLEKAEASYSDGSGYLARLAA